MASDEQSTNLTTNRPCDKVSLKVSLTELATEIRRVLTAAKHRSQEDRTAFEERDYGQLGAALGAYTAFFKKLGVCSRQLAEQLWQKHYADPDVCDAVEDLLQTEDEWDNFLQAIDEGMQALPQMSSLDTPILSGVTLTTLTASQDFTATSVEGICGANAFTYLDRLSALDCAVCIVSFGNETGAERWKEETACPFPIFLDKQRLLYRNLGMPRSMHKTMNFYGEKIAQNVPLPQAYTDVEDDPLQMGGDCIFNQEGKLVYVHRSQHPADRPGLETIITTLQRHLNSSKKMC